MNIRPATSDDVSSILLFIQKKSEFDRSVGAFSGQLRVTAEKLHQTLFGSHPFAMVLFVEIDGRDVGFALYGFRYSSFAGQPSIWLDDLYINENCRSQGAGAALMVKLAHIAKDHHCTHLAWTADAQNQRGLSFYHRLGAEISEQYGDRCYFKWIPKQ